MRIGIIGYGSVAALHADALASMPQTEVAVWGPDPPRTASFAAGVRGGCEPAESFEALIARSDGVVIASPSPLHEPQAEQALVAGRATLVELPACGSAAGGEHLAALARDRGVLLRGVHASRFLAPYVLLGSAIQAGRIGAIERISYRRTLIPRSRSWTDDALRHHAQHPLDLLLDWFGAATATRCDTWVRDGARVAVAADVTLASGVSATVEVRYEPGAAPSLMRVQGTDGVLESDGFTWLAQDGAAHDQPWDAASTYAASIERCDALFLDAIAGRPVGPTWDETLRVARIVDGLEAIERRHDG